MSIQLSSTARLFVSLQVVSLCGFLLIVLTAALSSSITRNPTWYSFCLSWTLSAFGYIIGTIAGLQRSKDPKINGFCTLQVGMVYAGPVVTSMATFCLVLHIYMKIKSSLSHIQSAESFDSFEFSPIRERPMRSFLRWIVLLTALPYMLYICVFAAFLIVALKNPELVSLTHSGTYCHISRPLSSKITSAIVIAILTATLLVQCSLAYLLLQNRSLLLKSSTTKYYGMALRAGFFAILGVCAVG
ncbi:hypothetical protein DL96DRAFT_1591747 [Flagelloscypha sp. PMI_526]|nr:hypothetical protein DL96DRAFT_1591747 [Flagelloscypha sp. PMI_526]